MSTDREALRKAADAQIDRWEGQLTDVLMRLWERQEGVVLARLQGTKARKNTRHWEPVGERKLDDGYVVDMARWTTEAQGHVRGLFERLMVSIFGHIFRSMQPKTPDLIPVADEDIGTNLPDELPDDFILEIMASRLQRRLDLIARGVQTSTAKVQKVIAEGEAAGKPMDEIAADVKATYDQQKQGWTDKIVTTNVVGALNESALGGASQAGCVEKQWLSAHDTRVRPTHRAADGQRQPITAKFHLGGIPEHPAEAWLDFPGDPTGPADEVINCRCTVIFPLDIGPNYESGHIPFADTEHEPPAAGELGFPEEKALRHVRTPEGAREYHEPIGAVITAHEHHGRVGGPYKPPTDHPEPVLDANRALADMLSRLPAHDPDRKVDWVAEGELDEHHRAYASDPDYAASFNAWYADAHGTPYAPVEQPVAKYRSYGGSSLWVYADGHGSGHFTGKAGTAENKELTADEVTAVLAKGAFKPQDGHHASKPGGHATSKLAALLGGGGDSHGTPHHGPALVPPTDVAGLPGVRWTDERSPGGPTMTLDDAQLKAAFDLVGIEMTPGLKINVHLRDQANAGEQGVTWQSGSNSFEVVVKVLPGKWPEPEGSLYVVNNSLLHELRHVRQAQLDPKGHQHFSADYVHENQTVGYAKNKYEIEARLFGHLADPTGSKPVPAGMNPGGKAEWVLGAAA